MTSVKIEVKQAPLEENVLKARVRRRHVLLGFAASMLIGAAHAQGSYPSQAIRIIVPWPPGGGADVMIRLLGPGMSKVLGQPVIVENRPGAGGIIGHAYVAKAPADGHTVMFSSTDSHAVVPQVNKQAQYGPRDFVGVASLGLHPMGLVVHPSVKATTVAELVQLGASSKDPLTYGSYGIGTAAHVMMEAFAATAKIKMQHVPFQGSTPMVQAIMGGQLISGLAQVSALDPYARAGSVRMLAVTHRERLPSFPNVPTFKEQGFALEVGSWAGIIAPARTPAAVVAKLNEAVRTTFADPAVTEKFVTMGAVMDRMGQAEFDKFILSEYDRWGAYIRDNKITVE